MQPLPIIISGGSRGLGLALVQHCLRRGCPVSTFARQQTDAITQLTCEYPKTFEFAKLDAANAAQVEAYVENVTARFGSIYGLVNNAAVGQDHLLAHMPVEAIDTLLAVNLRAPILLTRAVLRKMMLNPQGGRIVNITSICATRGFPALTVYSATKGGMEAFTRSLAREVGERNIRVNAIAPGFFASAMSSPLAASQLERIRRRTPTERLCTEADILPFVDMLLFENINVTGQSFAVDGGASV